MNKQRNEIRGFGRVLETYDSTEDPKSHDGRLSSIGEGSSISASKIEEMECKRHTV